MYDNVADQSWPQRPLSMYSYIDTLALVMRRPPTSNALRAILTSGVESARIVRSKRWPGCLHVVVERPTRDSIAILDDIAASSRNSTLSRVELATDFRFATAAQAVTAIRWAEAHVVASWGGGYLRREHETIYFARGGWRRRTLSVYPRSSVAHFELRFRGATVCRAGGFCRPADVATTDIATRVLGAFAIGVVDVVAMGRAAFRERGRAGVSRSEAESRGKLHAALANHSADEPEPCATRCAYYARLRNWRGRIVRKTPAFLALNGPGVITPQTLRISSLPSARQNGRQSIDQT